MLTLTEKTELLNLMCNEFHDDDGNFNDREAKAFISRLTDDQLSLLESSPDNQLIAFITAGDGYIERSMGLDFCHIVSSPARATASFALFYKSSNTSIELAFYSRFFLISYATYQPAHTNFRNILDTLQASKYDPDNSDLNDFKYYMIDNEETRKAILYNDAYPWMIEQAYLQGRRAYNVSGFLNSRNKAKCYYLSLSNRFKHEMPMQFIDENSNIQSGNYYFPYTYLRNRNRNGTYQTPNWFAGNAIHGLYNTRGCWSLLRNYHWQWPQENIDIYADTNHQTHFLKGDSRPLNDIFMDAYFDYRRNKKKCSEIDGDNLLLWNALLWKYYEYSEFPLERRSNTAHFQLDDVANFDLQIFRQIAVDFLSGTKNSFNHSYLNFLNLFTGAQFTSRLDHVGVPVGSVTANNNNIFEKTFRPVFGENIYGQSFDRAIGWTQLYIFRARHSSTNSFTPDYNDAADGHKFVNP